jgi:hypothetical protein
MEGEREKTREIEEGDRSGSRFLYSHGGQQWGGRWEGRRAGWQPAVVWERVAEGERREETRFFPHGLAVRVGGCMGGITLMCGSLVGTGGRVGAG